MEEKKPVDCIATRTAKAAGIPIHEMWENEQSGDLGQRSLGRRIDIRLDEAFNEQKPEKSQWDQMVDLFYCRTNHHVALVNKYAEIIYYRFPEICAELVTNARQHDASKYQSPEYIPYVYLTWGKRNNMDFTKICETMPECRLQGFKSPADILAAIDKATFHHITTNKHHPEAHDPRVRPKWEAKQTTVVATAMDTLSIAEMCADWAGMSAELGTSLTEWAYKNINKWRFHPHQKRQITDFLTICVQNG